MNVSEIKYLLSNHHKNCPHNEVNFILSHSDTIACFCDTQTEYHSIFAITDIQFNPIFFYETNAYISACGISDNGNYAIFRTAHSPNEDDDKAFFVDVLNKSIMWEKTLDTKFVSIKGFFIDTNKQTITESHDDFKAVFSFNGEFLNKDKWLSERYKHKNCSPYEKLGIALEIIESIKDSNYDEKKLKLAIKYIKEAEATPSMSTYQLSLAYRQLGDCYLSFSDKINALTFYKNALELNPNLPIKRIVRRLEKLNQNATV